MKFFEFWICNLESLVTRPILNYFKWIGIRFTKAKIVKNGSLLSSHTVLKFTFIILIFILIGFRHHFFMFPQIPCSAGVKTFVMSPAFSNHHFLFLFFCITMKGQMFANYDATYNIAVYSVLLMHTTVIISIYNNENHFFFQFVSSLVRIVRLRVKEELPSLFSRSIHLVSNKPPSVYHLKIVVNFLLSLKRASSAHSF